MDFLHFMNDLMREMPFHFELYYSKTLDWQLRIWRKGLGEDGNDIEVFSEQNLDLDFLLAMGEVAVKTYLLEKIGGY